MKSMTIRPPRSRSLSCRAISSAASRLVANAVSSISSPLVARAELISIETSASVWSMTMLPPEGSSTVWRNADSIWLSIWNRVNRGTGSSYSRSFGRLCGIARSTNWRASSQALLSSMMISPMSALRWSRSARMIELLSWKTRNGAGRPTTAALIASQMPSRYSRSQLISSVDRPTPAVRTMTPMPSGISISRSVSRSSSRSSPLMRRDTPPARGLFGISTMKRPARLMKVVRAAPLLPRSSFSTWTTISWPSRSRSLKFRRPAESGSLRKYSRDISFRGRKPCRLAPYSTNAASRLGSMRVIRPL